MPKPVMPLVGGQGGPTRNLGAQLTLFQLGEADLEVVPTSYNINFLYQNKNKLVPE